MYFSALKTNIGNTEYTNSNSTEYTNNNKSYTIVMNSQLVTAGYPWVVVPMNRRQEYMEALEQASVGENIEAFARFVQSLM